MFSNITPIPRQVVSLAVERASALGITTARANGTRGHGGYRDFLSSQRHGLRHGRRQSWWAGWSKHDMQSLVCSILETRSGVQVGRLEKR